MKDKLIKTTCELIKFRTEPDNISVKKSILDHIKYLFQDQPVFIKEFLSNQQPSLLITFEDTLHPQVLLYSHLDVVPAPETEYNPQVKEGKIYGRGSGDMKSAAAVILHLFQSYIDSNKKPSIGLIFTCDEEVGGFNGTKHILQEKVSCELCIMPDSSKGTDTIITNQKGVAATKIWAHGKSAHGSRPHLGINAIEKITKDLVKIRKLFPKTQKANTKTTLTIGTIKGGEQTNQIPEYAEATLDIRYENEKSFYKIFNKIKKITNDNTTIDASASPYLCDLENKLVKDYIKSQQKTLNKTIKFEKESGCSDARFFSEKNIPVIVTGIDKANSHSIDESCTIDDMVNFYNILKDFTDNYVDILS